MAETALKCTGIMRHAQAFWPGMDEKEEEPGSPLTKTGLNEARAVGRRFAENLCEHGSASSQVTVVCADSKEAKATAAALVAGLAEAHVDGLVEPASPVSLTALGPANWPPGECAGARWQAIHAEIEHELGSTNGTLVVVGHDPQVSWILHHLVGDRGQRSAGPLPLARGELAMLSGPPNRLALRWVLSPSDEKAIEQLHDKIKSKMDTAKLLGAFLTAVLLFAAKELASASDPPVWYAVVGGLGLVLLAMATAAYFVTMFMYDGLLMPVRFWPSPHGSAGPHHPIRRWLMRVHLWPSTELPRGFVVRPPSSAAWVLYQNMMRVWFYGFIPATLLGGCGAVAVTVALATPDRWWWWLLVALSIAAVVGFTLWVRVAAKPKLGVSD